MQLRNGITTYFPWCAVMVSNALRAFLKTAANDNRCMVHFPDDQHRADDARGQALQHDGLIVVDGYLGAVVGKRYCVGRWRRIFWEEGRWRRRIHTTGRLVDVNDVHDERVYEDISNLVKICVWIPYPSSPFAQ